MPKPDEWVSTVDPATGSEFGGVPGLVQPLPHVLTDSAADTANYMKSVPADEMVQAGVDQLGNPIMEFASTYDVPPTQQVRP